MTNTAKYSVFFNSLNDTIGGLDVATVKTDIGDSIVNNRVLTVSQTIRFLTNSGKKNLINLGTDLDEVYGILQPTIKNFRSPGRTDAIDINEFLRTFEFLLIDGGDTSLRRTVSRAIGA